MPAGEWQASGHDILPGDHHYWHGRPAVITGTWSVLQGRGDSPNNTQVVGGGHTPPWTAPKLSYEVLMVLVQAVGAGPVLSFPLGSVVVTVISVHTRIFVSPVRVINTYGNVLMVHVSIVKIHVVKTLLS